eukprot:m.47602 g.47602  ORF g.47602 m.47602 type:complete len:5714 (+) comp33810_c0_seq1:99-17240(+)
MIRTARYFFFLTAVSLVVAVPIHVVRVRENIPNAFVADVSESSPLPLKYALVSDGSAYACRLLTQFVIDRDSGVIRTRVGLDYESADGNRFNLVVSAQLDAEKRRVTIIRVIIEDVNDNRPVFSRRGSLRGFIGEKEPADTAVMSLYATDVDEVGAIAFRVISGNDRAFSMGPTTVIGRFFVGEIRLVGSLDREAQEAYDLVVEAYDGVQSTQVDVHVQIGDVNDNSPKFLKSNYNVSVSEVISPGTSVGQVSAVDVDEGLNAEVYYSLSSADFSVDPYSGVITCEKGLMGMGGVAHQLQVWAHDRGLIQRNNSVYFTVNVIRENRHKPEIQVSLNNQGFIQEDVSGATVATIFVTDKDVGVNGADVDLKLSNELDAFTVIQSGHVFTLRTARQLDREAKDEYHLVIVAADRGVPSLTARELVTIHVSDVNDNSPVFAQSQHFSQIYETVLIGTPVVAVQATDADAGSNADLVYTFSSADSSVPFDIDRNTGLIFVLKSLDAGQQSIYQMNVTATDEKGAGLHDTTQVLIEIKDENNHSPQFLRSLYQSHVQENQPAGIITNSVTATDGDVGFNQNVSYSLIFNNPSKPDPFLIDEKTGVISNTQALDYEDINYYVLTVRATDQGLPYQRFSDVKVFVNVTNENDNPPVFFPSSYSPLISKKAVIGTKVTRLRALDKDGDKLLFSLLGSSASLFKVDINGDITTNTALSQNSYILNVAVSDGVHSALALVDITTYESSLRAPIFVNKMYTFPVSETSNSGYILGQVSASSQDGFHIVYGIVNGNVDHAFVISQSGFITLNGSVDYEVIKSYALTVSATDISGVAPRTGLAQVNVNVLNSNDNPPVFLHNTPRRIYLPQDVNVGNTVLTVTAGDVDNDILIYTLTDLSNTFSLPNPRQGVIRLSKTLLVDPPLSFSGIYINVSDGVHSDSLSLAVTVVDINNHAPVFQPISNITVNEDAVVGSLVAATVAVDADEGYNALVRYGIQGIKGPFEIDALTGHLTLKSTLDFETQSQYTIALIVGDLGSPQKFNSASVTVTVNNVNDLPPTFERPHYNVRISEDEPIGMVMLTLTASDPDGCSPVTYALASDVSGRFLVERFSGAVVIDSLLDREVTPQIDFIVEAVDCGSHPLTSTATVHIELLDVNDERPVFPVKQYAVNVRQDLPVGAKAMTVHADDLDVGINGSLTYQLKSGGAQTWFVDSQTGSIVLAKPLQVDDLFVLTVVAVDVAAPFQFDEVKVAIRVIRININYHRPAFPRFLSFLSTYENSFSHFNPALIMSVNAIDADSGRDGQLTYYLSEGTGFDSFDINSTTGDLVVSRSLDRESQSFYSLLVEVQDGGLVPYTAQMEILVNVLDVNDNRPVATLAYMEGSVHQCSGRDDFVILVTAFDVDNGTSGEFAYSIDHPKFDIDVNYGIISSKPAIIYDDPSYEVVVTMEDKGVPSLRSTVFVQIDRVDCKKISRPQFLGLPYRTRVLENQEYHYVYQAVAVNVEHYSLSSSSDTQYFSINSLSGVLSCQPLDYETQNVYYVGIIATVGSMTTSANVTVEVINKLDEKPEFSNETYHATIPEDFADDTVILKVFAQGNHQVSYSLVLMDPSARDLFYINSDSGAVRKHGELDHESRKEYVLYVQAQYTQSHLLSITTLTVSLLDVDDSLPVFDRSPYHVMLQSPLQSNSSVLSVYAVDADSSAYSAIEYRLESPSSYFYVNSLTGELTMVLPFSGQYVSVYVNAENPHNRTRKTTVEVRVSVLTAGMDPPTFNPPKVVAVDVKESEPLTSVILSVKKVSGSGKPIMYSINGGNFNSTFGISSTGDVFIAKSLKVGLFHLVVRATVLAPVTMSDDITYLITVLPVNRHRPVFAVYSPLQVNVSEDSSSGTFVALVKAYDSDFGRDGDVTYSIQDDQSAFNIDPVSGLITVRHMLDYEKSTFHSFTLIASDNGIPPRSSRLLVGVNVLDVDDPAPNFLFSTYSVSMNEDVPVGTSVVTLSAIDRLGLSMWYSSLSPLFSVNPVTGVVVVASSLDRDQKSVLQVDFSVSNGLVSNGTKLTVALRDVNDNTPKFNQKSYRVNVSESSAFGLLMHTIHADDPDEGANGTVEYFLKSAMDPISMSLFEVLLNGSIVLRGAVDREFQDYYYLVIEATDSGSPPRKNFTELDIFVADENDHAPVFAASFYRVSVKEDEAIGATILTTPARDRDAGSNGVISYALLTGNVGGSFRMDPAAGSLVVAKKLDYETEDFYTLVIEATDHGSVALKTTCTVHVSVQDVLDTSPEFSKDVYEVSIEEGRSIGSAVVSVKAVSILGIKFLAVSENFSVNAETGLVVTKTVLDYEKASSLRFEVEGTDVYHQANTAEVIVSLTDINDNRPEFEKPFYEVWVPDDAVAGAAIVLVSAHDKDAGMNGRVTYYFVDNNTALTFDIDLTKGLITLAASLIQLRGTTLQFAVSARDNGSPSFSALHPAHVIVHIVAPHYPAFEKTVFYAEIVAPIDVRVIQVNAVDVGANQTLTYSIYSGDEEGHFVINATSGVVTVAKPLGLAEFYNLHIEVTDGFHSDFTTVLLNATSLFEFRPMMGNIAIDENIPVGTSIIRPDLLTTFEDVTYRMKSPFTEFDVRDNGEIFLAFPLDRESKSSYELTIEAVHPVEPIKLTKTTLHINVTDVNDNSPQFLGPRPFRGYFRENLSPPTDLYEVFVSDPDDGSNGQIRSFNLQGRSPSSPFQISSNGVVYLTQPSDSLTLPEYSLSIEVTDGGGRSAVAALNLVKITGDSQRPIFEQSVYVFRISEGLLVGTAFGVVRAFARHSPPLLVRYSVISGNGDGVFRVRQNGILSVAKKLDYEKERSYNLIIRVYDVDFSDVNVSIYIQDANDHPPRLPVGDNLRFSVNEDESVGAMLTRIPLIDEDEGAIGFHQFEMEDKYNGTFTISSSGEIFLRRKLDYESRQIYNFDVIVRDFGDPILRSVIHCRVFVININDVTPHFVDTYRFSATNSTTNGAVIGQVFALDEDSLEPLKYSLASGNDQGVFSLDIDSGLLLNQANQRGDYHLSVRAFDGKFSAYATVNVSVEDVNRHAPVFVPGTCRASVMEGSALGSFVTRLTATDPDFGTSGIITYSSSSSTFRVVDVTGDVYTNVFPEKLMIPPKWLLSTVQAVDGSSSSTSCQLNVTLIDVNNNVPQFLTPSYVITVKDDFNIQNPLIRVSASDADEGSNSEIEYSILRNNSTFSIDNQGGIYTSAKLDVKRSRRHSFQVQAKDKGQPPLASTANVTIDVTDVLSRPPDFGQFDFYVSIEENLPGGAYVTTMNASNASGSVTYLTHRGTILKYNNPKVIAIEWTSGRVTTTTALDRELVPEYFVFIEAENRVGKTIATLHVTVLDVNDNSPKFQVNQFQFRVAENRPAGTVVAQINAVDGDSGLNGEVTYSLYGLDAHLFEINPTLGYISTKTTFDRESLSPPIFQFIVKAADRGQHPLSAEVVGTIEVTDINDNPVYFAKTEFSVSVKEDAHLGYRLPVALLVKDGDAESVFSFSIIDGNVGNAFGVMSETGELRVQRKLDCETLCDYDLQVSVSDGRFHSTAFVNVTVIDVNDVSPTFSNTSYPVNVIENALEGSFVFQVDAFDGDVTPDEVTYSMQVVQGPDSFDINKTSGVIRTTRRLDRDEDGDEKYSYSILAYDAVGNSGQTYLNVLLRDVNDNAPFFAGGPYVGHVKEDVPLGTSVGQFAATDRDIGSHGMSTYFLLDDAGGRFNINGTSGWVLTEASFDRERANQFAISIRAVDGSVMSLSGETNVTIVIEDVNDNAPYFPSTNMESRIYEDSPVGSQVLSLSALDDDIGTNALIDYSIESGNINEVFTIDKNIVKVAKMPKDFPDTRRYALTIQLSDSGTPVMHGKGTLVVAILDANDHAPVFWSPIYHVSVYEDVKLFTDILAVNATDADWGLNSRVHYNLVDINNAFSLSKNGYLQVAGSLDYESEKTHNLTIEAIDEGSRIQLTGTASVLVTVLDVNDNAPVFETPHYIATILENYANETKIQLLATDADTGNGGNVVAYALQSPASGFSINSNTGLFSVTAVLDREFQSSYNLTVLAVDGGNPQLTGKATIYVTVADVNDNPSQGGWRNIDVVVFREELGIGSSMIGTVNAGDPDIGDTFSCKDVKSTAPAFVTVDTNCSVIMMTNNVNHSFEAVVTLMATDGVHPYVDCNVTVGIHLAERTDFDIIALVEINTTPGSLLDMGYGYVRRAFADSLEVDQKRVHLLTIKDNANEHTVYVGLAVSGWSRDVFIARLSQSLSMLPFHVVSLPVDLCSGEPCRNGADCVNTKRVNSKNATSISTEFNTLVYPSFEMAYECTCRPGSTGSFCETDINDCFSRPCQNGGTCVDQVQDYICICPPNVKGSLCEKIPNSCSANNPCKNGGKCQNDISGPKCFCSNAYLGSTCEISVFKPENDCDSSPCQNDGTCSSGPSDYTCTCQLGYTGKTCEKLTSETRPCTSNPCKHGGKCFTIGKNFICACPTGYLGGFIGSDCSWELNPCDELPCLNGGTCYRGRLGRYACDCTAGFSGLNCEVAPPSCRSSPCQNGGKCIEDTQANSYYCACGEAYYGKDCELLISPLDYCSSVPCQNGGNCTAGRDSYTCTCRPGYYGKQCQHHGTIDTCSSNPCLYGSFCIANGSGFDCVCSPGFYGRDCGHEYDHCDSAPCFNGGLCMPDVNSFICSCPVGVGGWFCETLCLTGYTGIDCDEEIDACLDGDVHCLNNGTCYTEWGRAVCACTDDYEGPLCGDLKTCNCKNGGTCDSKSRLCQCPSGYEGSKCELTHVSFQSGTYRAFPAVLISSRGSVDMEIASNSPSGLIMYNSEWTNAAADDVIAVELIGGRVSVLVDMGDGPRRFEVGSIRVDDGKWHSISVSHIGKDVHVSVDMCAAEDAACQRDGFTPGQKEYLNVGLPWYFGSVRGVGLAKRDQNLAGFQGCIRNVHVDGILLDLADYILENGTEEGCSELTACSVRNPCGKEATCVDKYGGSECLCSPGKSGRHCKEDAEAVTFSGSNYIRYSFLREISRRDTSSSTILSSFSESVLFLVRPKNPDGFLFKMAGQNASEFSVLELSGGYLRHTLNIGNGIHTITINKTVLDDRYHVVSVHRVGTSVTVAVDEVRQMWEDLGTEKTFEFDAEEVYLGGVPGETGFSGCLKDPSFDDVSLPLSGEGNNARAFPSAGVSTGCSCPDLCAKSPCMEPDQLCLQSEIDKCFTHLCSNFDCSLCQNGAVCDRTETSCSCLPAYRGVLCSEFRSESSGSVAHDNAVVIIISVTIAVALLFALAIILIRRVCKRKRIRIISEEKPAIILTAVRRTNDNQTMVRYGEEGGGEGDTSNVAVTTFTRASESLSTSTSLQIIKRPAYDSDDTIGSDERPSVVVAKRSVTSTPRRVPVGTDKPVIPGTPNTSDRYRRKSGKSVRSIDTRSTTPGKVTEIRKYSGEAANGVIVAFRQPTNSVSTSASSQIVKRPAYDSDDGDEERSVSYAKRSITSTPQRMPIRAERSFTPGTPKSEGGRYRRKSGRPVKNNHNGTALPTESGETASTSTYSQIIKRPPRDSDFSDEESSVSGVRKSVTSTPRRRPVRAERSFTPGTPSKSDSARYRRKSGRSTRSADTRATTPRKPSRSPERFEPASVSEITTRTGERLLQCIKEADSRDEDALPPDEPFDFLYEGQGSSAGSLSSIFTDEDEGSRVSPNLLKNCLNVAESCIDNGKDNVNKV